MIRPQALQPGDLIYIVCPAGAVEPGEEIEAVKYLENLGFRVQLGSTVGSNYYRFAGTDEQRRLDMQYALDDKDVSAIWCGRGGYGSVRIIDDLDFGAFAQKPKWLIGFSDITCFHSYLHAQVGVCTLHGHMLKGFQNENQDLVSTEYLISLLRGETPTYEWDDITGQNIDLQAEVIGGNLAILSDLIGTNCDVNTDGKILIIEEVGEYYYNIDRMLMQLSKAGKLQNLAALIVGSFSDTQDNEVPFGESLKEIIQRVTKDYDIPIVYDMPIGHQKRNWPLMLGAEYQLILSDYKARLTLTRYET